MKKRRAVLTALAAVLLLSACGKGDNSPESGAETTAPAATEQAKEETLESDSLLESESEETSEQEEDGGHPEETDSGETIRIFDDGYSDTDWDEIAQQTIFYIACSRLQVLNDGYDNLNKALGEYWDGAWEELKGSHDANYDDAVENASQYPGGEEPAPYYEMTRTGHAVRGDSKIFSFLDMDYSYLGGAHPFTATHGVSFDAASGKRLSIQDVAADYDGFCRYVKACLEEMNREAGDTLLFEWYEEDLQKYFSGEYSLEWVMDQEGITVYFDPYALAPYAEGTLEVPVRFAEHPEFFKQDYIPAGKGIIKRGDWDQPVKADVNGDGRPEEIFVSYEQGGVEFSGTMRVSAGENSAAVEEYGSLSGWWVLQDEDGGVWCYVQMQGDNDWPTVEVFDLRGGQPSYTDALQAVIMQEPASDSGRFCMASRMDFLGSYYGYRDYHIGENGLPEAFSESYRIYRYGGTENYLTTAVPLSAAACEDENDMDGEKITIPAGTKLYPRSTDGKSWMLAEREDGSLCRIFAEGEPYALTIDGVSEYDCFENLFYAG